MDFRDRKVIKKLEFIIEQAMDNAVDPFPIVLYADKDYSRMNDDIHSNIKIDGLIILPLAINKDYPFLVVGKDYQSAWTCFCDTLQKNMFSIVNNIVKTRNRRLNVDALSRSINKFKAVLEEEEQITLPDFVFVINGEKIDG